MADKSNFGRGFSQMSADKADSKHPESLLSHPI